MISFSNLEPITENVEAVKEAIEKGMNIHILSATPMNHCKADKIKWLHKYIPNLKDEKMHFCKVRDNKAVAVKDENGILLDDIRLNIRLWKQSGRQAYTIRNKNIKEVLKRY